MTFKKSLFLIALVVASCAGTYFGLSQHTKLQKVKEERLLHESRKAAWVEFQQRAHTEINQFKGEVSVVVKDLETGWEFSREKAKPFASASLAKIPLMAACFLAADQGRIKLDRNIPLKASDKLTGSGVLKDMPTGTAFSIWRLIGLMIYDSDNTATHILTNLVGLDYVNNASKSFGLKNTRLSRKIADYHARDNKGIENYTTAEDMSLLLEKIYRKSLGNKKISDQCINTLKLTRINDRIPKYLPSELTIAHKTGLEKTVCHDAGIVFTKKGDFIVVVLTKHENPDSKLSAELIAKVALYAYNYLDSSEDVRVESV